MQFQNPRIDVKLCAPNHTKSCAARHTLQKDIQNAMEFDTCRNVQKEATKKTYFSVSHSMILLKTSNANQHDAPEFSQTPDDHARRTVKNLNISLGVSSILKIKKNDVFLTIGFFIQKKKCCSRAGPVASLASFVSRNVTKN